MNVFCSPYAFGFFDLSHEVIKITDACGCRIGYAVSGYDLKHILFLSEIAVNILSGRCRCCPCSEWRQRAFLYACIHIGFIVVADIKYIIVEKDGEKSEFRKLIEKCSGRNDLDILYFTNKEVKEDIIGISHDEQEAPQKDTHADIEEIFKKIKSVEYDAGNEILIIRE